MMLNENERNALREQIAKLLDEYDYEYNTTALNKIVNEWAEQKGWLIEAFKKHPNYVDGKYLIAFDTDYERTIDYHGIREFRDWIQDVLSTTKYIRNLPPEINEQRQNQGCICLPNNAYGVFYDLHWLKTRELDAEWANRINRAFPNIKTRAGAKTSRVINKICTYLHYNEHPDYNREFAKYADALSPLTIKRHTVLSLNPLDYLTMSFGNSWSSCHTIDKENKRRMRDGFGGGYSSGTVSYMLDDCSMVLYTVDEKYEGTDYYSQPKINRQMFHYGEDKLVQGRLYPQCMDCDSDAYTPYRKIVQEIIAKIFDFPNLWTVSHTIEQVESEGTHYRDYTHFNTCTLSRPNGTHNDCYFTIGAEPICVECGCRHNCEENINCCGGLVRCADCGEWIDEDDAHEIDGEYYCDDCCTWCNYCDEYVREETHYVSGHGEVCESCLEEYFTQCDRCGHYHRNRNTLYYEEDDAYYCERCYAERMEELREEAEEENEDTTENQTGEWRVVNRTPRVGDYIRVIKNYYSFNEIGDILKVDAIHEYRNSPRVLGQHHPRDTHHSRELWNYWPGSYEVIEKVED